MNKLYESIAWEKMAGINEYKRALDKIEDFIYKNGMILYGGMAIDFSLKDAGFEGIYPENILPDYDFYSPNILKDIDELSDILKKEKFEGIKNFVGLHACTRKLSINIHYPVADLSYYPQIYLKNIPIRGKKLKYVSPNYQRIDIHRSLSYLYENAPRDNYKNRLKKDVERLFLIEEKLPFKPESVKKIEGEYCINYLDQKFKGKINWPPYYCVSGFLAYKIYYDYIKSLNRSDIPKLAEPLENITPEIFIDNYPETENTTIFEKTCDILPQAVYKEGIMFFINHGQRISICEINKKKIVCINYLCCTFLFKYYMKGIYAEYYKSCLEIFKFLLKYEPKLAISADYFGNLNISDKTIYNEKIDICKFEGIKYEPYPTALTKGDEYDVYKITGAKTDKLNIKKIYCPLSFSLQEKEETKH